MFAFYLKESRLFPSKLKQNFYGTKCRLNLQKQFYGKNLLTLILHFYPMILPTKINSYSYDGWGARGAGTASRIYKVSSQ